MTRPYHTAQLNKVVAAVQIPIDNDPANMAQSPGGHSPAFCKTSNP